MLYLFTNIGGFNIKLSFEENKISDRSLEYISNKLKKDIFNYLKMFVLKEKPAHIDFEILFTDIHNPEIVAFATNKNKGTTDMKEYIAITQKISPKKILTYYHISLSQFQRILMHLVQNLLIKKGGFILHSSSSTCTISTSGLLTASTPTSTLPTISGAAGGCRCSKSIGNK